MKVANYIAEFLINHGIDDVFTVSYFQLANSIKVIVDNWILFSFLQQLFDKDKISIKVTLSSTVKLIPRIRSFLEIEELVFKAVENAKYLFFTSSADENKRYTDFQFDKEAIIMGTGGNATLHYYNGKFSVSTDCLVLFPNSKIKCKYLYYFFLKTWTFQYFE